MKNHLALALTVGGLLALSTGCASQNNSLQAQVNALTEKGAAQDQEITHLKEVAKDEATKAKDTTITSAEDAWAWVKAHSEAAWNSQTSVDARSRFQKCWNDLSNGR